MEERRIKLEEVSEGLRSALEASRWPNGQCEAIGVGPDGVTRYFARVYPAPPPHRRPGERSRQETEPGPERVEIELLPQPSLTHLPQRITIPEPEGVIWEPILIPQEPLKFELLSEGLRRALEEGRQPDGRCVAGGVGPDGTPYWAGGSNGFWIHRSIAVTPNLPVPEPEGVIWRPILPYDKWLKLEEVSPGLRQALNESRWPDGRHSAVGVGADGTDYFAWMHYDDRALRRVVSIDEFIAGTPLGIPPPEPEGVVWKPTLTVREWLRLETVTERLRKALAQGRQSDGSGAATGVGPDGHKYRAHVGRDDLVFIDFANSGIPEWSRQRVPMHEPEGIVWKPVLPPRERPWWRFWK